jgi:glutamate N-acetyltransferase/amino-acid N-acetyltransferase
LEFRMKRIDGAITAPKGFKAAGVRCGIKQQGSDLAIIYSEVEASAAGVFTTNAFKAAPVIRSMEAIKVGKGRAIVVNSGNANSCTGNRGLKDVDHIRKFAGELLNVPAGMVFCASTGIIGQTLPMDKYEIGIMDAVAELDENGGGAASMAIMTTDTKPKVAACEIEIGCVPVRIGAICKGSGMICPNMATMLCFGTTDADIEPSVLQSSLSSAVDRSLNSLSVDGDMSTNDCVIILANSRSGCAKIMQGSPEYETFEKALAEICVELAKQIAHDGEGATKYVEVKAVNAETYADAKTVAMKIANSPLVKTAIFGEDPNWGRVLCAAGGSGVRVDPDRTSLYFGDVKIVEKGEPVKLDAEAARKPMLEKELLITVDLGLGAESATAFTCDFSYDYVKINAEYHT